VKDTQSGRDDQGRDLLGFLEARCPHCGACLYLSDRPDSQPICLNACNLPTWAYRLLQRGGATPPPQQEDGESEPCTP
jgi:hypothetical protein